MYRYDIIQCIIQKYTEYKLQHLYNECSKKIYNKIKRNREVMEDAHTTAIMPG